MAKQIITDIRSNQSCVRPSLAANREAQGPYRLEKQITRTDAAGRAVQIERETVGYAFDMFAAMAMKETKPKTAFHPRSFVTWTVLDATDHAVSVMDFALIHMGREAFDAYVNQPLAF